MAEEEKKNNNKNKTIGIVGAGVSGLLACKYALENGFRPVVFESTDAIGGVWAQTMETTVLQTPSPYYQFTDFPWPPEVSTEIFPGGTKVMEYIDCYARRFALREYIRFRSRVIGIDFVGPSPEEMATWDMWAGTGEAFGGDGCRGVWHIAVQQTSTGTEADVTRLPEVYQFDFLILCIGRFSGLPNIPSFPRNKGIEAFKGRVLHSMDYSNMSNFDATSVIKGKKVTIIGFSKSAIDISTECSIANGTMMPCTLLRRENRWIIPNYIAWGVPMFYYYFNRFSELLFHKPREGLLLSILATLLSPLRWFFSQFVESYLKWKYPLKKYDVVPSHSFFDEMSSSTIAILPNKFYDRVEEGSVVMKKSKTFYFDESGIITEDRQQIKSDVVIFATGFKGDKKIRDMFTSSSFQDILTGLSPNTDPITLYRECIHPRIPQLAIIGLCESLSNLYTSEIQCKWIYHFICRGFKLPKIKSMEGDVKEWIDYKKRYCRGRSSIGIMHNWYNDQLLKDMGYNTRRKKGFLTDLLIAYLPKDYSYLSD